jgi:proteasome lid subunit RPN8/RPN11
MMRMTAEQRAAIERHGEDTYPHECCGFLIGRIEEGEKRIVEVQRAGNEREDSPQNRYLISPLEIHRADRAARARGLDILGFYHSHPDVAARPSDYDRDHATWPGYTFVIVSVRQGKAAEMNAWVLTEDGSHFDAEPIAETLSGAGG